MSSRRSEIQVGLAVLVSLILLIGGILWGKGIRMAVSRYSIRVSFENIGGLEPGSNVLANGVIAGRVTGIELEDGKVYVKANVDKNVVLYSDAKFTVESPTLMAGRVLSILPGSKVPPLTDVQALVGTEPFGVSEAMTIMQDMAGSFKTTLKEMNALLTSMNAVAGDSAFQKSIINVANNADEVSKISADMLRNNRVQLEQTLDQLSATIASAERLTTKAAARIDTTFNAVDAALVEVTSLAASLREITVKMNDGSSTMGRLFTDDELYTRLNTTLADVDSLVVSIRKNGLRNKIVLF